MAKVDRLETLIQRELSLILQREIKDQVGFITITGVKVTNELSFIFAYYTVYGDETVLKKTQEALERAKGFIKNQIAAKVKMRNNLTPDNRSFFIQIAPMSAF